jgi:hypothetical protein
MNTTQSLTSSRCSTPSDMRAWNPSSDRFVFSELYRVTVSRLYSTLHTHSRSHRLWSVLPAQEVLAGGMRVFEGAIMHLPVYRLRRIPLLGSWMNKPPGNAPDASGWHHGCCCQPVGEDQVGKEEEEVSCRSLLFLGGTKEVRRSCSLG